MLKTKHNKRNGRITYSQITIGAIQKGQSSKSKPVLFLSRILDTGKATVSTLYLPDGKGKNLVKGIYAIEQEWNDNKLGNSCIPSGIYPLFKRKSGKYFTAYNKRWQHPFVFQVEDEAVKPRSAILIHAVSNSEQLQGCIAPALSFSVKEDGTISTNGTGRTAYTKLFDILKRKGVQAISIEDTL